MARPRNQAGNGTTTGGKPAYELPEPELIVVVDPAAGVRAGADGREHCGGRIHNGAAAGHCARTSQGPVMTHRR